MDSLAGRGLPHPAPDHLLLDMIQDAWHRQEEGGVSDALTIDIDRTVDILRAHLCEHTERVARLEAQVNDKERAHLEVKESLEELLALQELSVAIRSARDVRTVCQSLLSLARRVVDFQEGDIFLIDEQANTIVSANGASAHLHRTALFQLEEGIIDWVITSGKPMVIPEADQALASDVPSSPHDFLMIPLIVRNRGIGVFLLSTEPAPDINSQAHTLLALLTDQAAVAIEHARVYEELIAMNRVLESSYSHILRSERLAAIEDLAAGVAHEVNNPLQVISCTLELIKMQSDLSENTARYVDMMEHESQRIGAIVSDLTDFARRDKHDLQLQPVDANEIVRKSLALIRHQYKYTEITVALHLDDDLPRVEAYERELQQALMNVLTYARRAMPDGGALTITSTDKDEWVVLRFTDTGTGISDDLLEQIFHPEPFLAIKSTENGTVLGLSVALAILKKYQGIMEIENLSGGGTVITLKLPCCHAFA